MGEGGSGALYDLLLCKEAVAARLLVLKYHRRRGVLVLLRNGCVYKRQWVKTVFVLVPGAYSTCWRSTS